MHTKRAGPFPARPIFFAFGLRRFLRARHSFDWYTAVVTHSDKSNGYEEVASVFIAGRGRSRTGIGSSVVAEWARMLPSGATVLDLGCGTGMPVSYTLLERGLNVYGVDASPSMVAAFRSHLPGAPVECAAVEESEFFGRTFDAVIAWGLFFLLDPDVQRRLIPKAAAVLPSGGRFLFTAPSQICSWADGMTGQTSVSLGYDAYCNALESAGFSLMGTRSDEGENHYFFAQKK